MTREEFTKIVGSLKRLVRRLSAWACLPTLQSGQGQSDAESTAFTHHQMTTKERAILESLEAELAAELKKSNAAAQEWVRAESRIKEIKADLLKAYFAVFTR